MRTARWPTLLRHRAGTLASARDLCKSRTQARRFARSARCSCWGGWTRCPTARSSSSGSCSASSSGSTGDRARQQTRVTRTGLAARWRCLASTTLSTYPRTDPLFWQRSPTSAGSPSGETTILTRCTVTSGSADSQ
eukprot:Amastigsp_a7794_26.p2 type:complete len:136 gc:universal Amastigsp_a7794_26:598-1005(+)